MIENAAAPLDRFGRFLMENLRDRCIDHFDVLAQGKWRSPNLEALQAEVAGMGAKEREVIRRCIVAALDGAIHDFCFKLQELADFENDIQVLVAGENIVPFSHGIHGELFGDDGWRARFSKHGEPSHPA